jgi:hypothetical protein
MKVDAEMKKGSMDGICKGFESFFTHCAQTEWDNLSDDDKKMIDAMTMPYDGAQKTRDQMCGACGRTFMELKMKMDGEGQRRLGQHTTQSNDDDQMPAATCEKMDAFLDGPCTKDNFDVLEFDCIVEQTTTTTTTTPDPATSGAGCYANHAVECESDGATEADCTGMWLVNGQMFTGCSPTRQLSSHADDQERSLQGSGYGYGYGMTMDIGFSKGSCYGQIGRSGKSTECNVDEATCREGDGGVRGGNGRYWYAPGYVSGYSGCCHCKYGCTETPNGVPVGSPEDTCTYNDPVSAGSCYRAPGRPMVECNVDEASCKGTKWYEPGYESTRSSALVDTTKANGCCHCFGDCPNPEARSEACKDAHYDGHPYPPPDAKVPKCGSNGLEYDDLKEFVELKKKMCAAPQ